MKMCADFVEKDRRSSTQLLQVNRMTHVLLLTGSHSNGTQRSVPEVKAWRRGEDMGSNNKTHVTFRGWSLG